MRSFTKQGSLTPPALFIMVKFFDMVMFIRTDCVSGSISSHQTQKTFRTLQFRTVEINSTDDMGCDGESVIELFYRLSYSHEHYIT